MRDEPVSLEEEATMSLDVPEYQHPEDDDFNPLWEENEWVDAAYMEYEREDDESGTADSEVPG
jgi:hypothetical protein